MLLFWLGRYLGLDSLDCKTIHEDRKLVPGVVTYLSFVHYFIFWSFTYCKPLVFKSNRHYNCLRIVIYSMKGIDVIV